MSHDSDDENGSLLPFGYLTKPACVGKAFIHLCKNLAHGSCAMILLDSLRNPKSKSSRHRQVAPTQGWIDSQSSLFVLPNFDAPLQPQPWTLSGPEWTPVSSVPLRCWHRMAWWEEGCTFSQFGSLIVRWNLPYSAGRLISAHRCSYFGLICSSFLILSVRLIGHSVEPTL